MTIHAVEIKDFDFKDYGIYYNMFHTQDNILYSKTDVYEDHMTRFPLIDTPGHLGYTIGQSAPYALKSMEKHCHTMEALFCAADPIVLCFAKSRENLPPQAEDIHAVILRTGDVAVLGRDIWHDACHGLGSPAAYYYLASCGESPADWVTVADDVVVEW